MRISKEMNFDMVDNFGIQSNNKTLQSMLLSLLPTLGFTSQVHIKIECPQQGSFRVGIYTLEPHITTTLTLCSFPFFLCTQLGSFQNTHTHTQAAYHYGILANKSNFFFGPQQGSFQVGIYTLRPHITTTFLHNYFSFKDKLNTQGKKSR